ncbi:MAG: PQQ-binding-like beta-propeller repeat protein [Bacteroidia bacterium]
MALYSLTATSSTETPKYPMTNSKALNPLTVQRIWNSTRGIYGVTACDGGWILRLVARVCKIDADAKVLWQVEFPDEGVAMDLPVKVVGDRVITASKKGNGEYELIALSCQDGKSLWKYPLNWTGMNTFGEIITRSERIFVPENRGTNLGGRILYAADGQPIGELDDWPTEAFNRGIGPLNPHIARVGKWLFMSRRSEEAYRLDLDAPDSNWRPVPEIARAILASNHETLMVFGKHQEVFAVMKVDLSSMEVIFKMPIKDLTPEIGVPIEIRVVDSDTALLLAKKGIAAISLSKSTVLWTYPLHDLSAEYLSGIVIGKSIVIQAETDHGNQLLEIDLLSGQLLKSTPGKGLNLSSGGWPLREDQLLMDATAKYILLERKPELPTLPEAEEFFVATTATAMPQPESPAPPTFTPTDQQYSAIITAFVNAKAAQEQGRDADHQRLAAEFNKLFDAFAQEHLEVSIANIARTLSELGVPYEVALGDVVRMRG